MRKAGKKLQTWWRKLLPQLCIVLHNQICATSIDIMCLMEATVRRPIFWSAPQPYRVSLQVSILENVKPNIYRYLNLLSERICQCRGKGGRNVGFRRCAVTLPGASGAATLRCCNALGGGWRCDAAMLPGAGDAVTLRRCRWASDAATRLALRRCDAGATLRRCDTATLEQRCDAVGAATLRRGIHAATLLALRCCDAGSTLRCCWRCDAATRDPRCDAVGAATLPSARVHTALLRGATR